MVLKVNDPSGPEAERPSRVTVAAVPLTTTGFDSEALHVAILGEDPLGWTLLREMDGSPVDGHPEVLDRPRSVVAATLLPSQAPTQWFGWSVADIVVWHRPDPEQLTPEQAGALQGFVAAGGTLIVSLDAGWANFARSRFGAASGIRYGAVRSLPAVWALAQVTNPNSGYVDTELPVVGAAPELGTEVRLAHGRQPLVLERPVGAGRMLVLPFDVADEALRGQVDRSSSGVAS